MSSTHHRQEHAVARTLEQFPPRPSARFYQRMQAAPWMAAPERTHQSFLRHLLPNRRTLRVAVILVVLLVGAVVLAPPLRVFAQDLLELFTRAPSDVVPKQQLEGAGSVEEAGPVPASLPTQAAATEFAVWLPSELPEAYQLEHVAHSPTEQLVASSYSYAAAPAAAFRFGERPTVTLIQYPSMHANNYPFYTVGASAAIEVVPIGETSGEYVEGGWTADSSEAEQWQWRSLQCRRLLRWQRGEVILTLETDSCPDQPGYLGRAELIELAAQVSPAAPNVPAGAPWRLLSALPQGEAATFAVWMPSALPERYRLEIFAYSPTEQMVFSIYSYAADPAVAGRADQPPPYFLLVQHPTTHATSDPLFWPWSDQGGAAAPIEVVPLGETRGEYVEGGGPAHAAEAEQSQWRSFEHMRRLRWQRGEVVLTLVADSRPDDSGFLSRAALIELAAQVAPAAEE